MVQQERDDVGVSVPGGVLEGGIELGRCRVGRVPLDPAISRVPLDPAIPRVGVRWTLPS